jgi:DNA-binding Xre family transcriptional regulator
VDNFALAQSCGGEIRSNTRRFGLSYVRVWCAVDPCGIALNRINPFNELLNSVNAKRASNTPSAAVADAAPNELTLALAHHLNVIKDERQLSQRGLAALTGLSQAYMRRVLLGEANIGLGMLLVISRALKVDPPDLISPIEPKNRTREK